MVSSMATTLKRLFWLSLLGGAGYAAWAVYTGRQADEGATAPEWPPIDPPSTADVGAAVPTSDDPDEPGSATTATAGFAAVPVDVPVDGAAQDASAASSPRWVVPVDGACPPGYAVKANDNSGIYHVPGGRFYDRTVPERCYATTDDAAADGYRPAKA